MKKKSKQITLVLVCALGLNACGDSANNQKDSVATTEQVQRPSDQDSLRRTGVHYAPAVYSPGYYSSPMFYMVPMVLSANAMRNYRRYQPYGYSTGSYRGTAVSNNTPGGISRSTGYNTNDPSRIARTTKPTNQANTNQSKGIFGWFRGKSSSSASSSTQAGTSTKSSSTPSAASSSAGSSYSSGSSSSANTNSYSNRSSSSSSSYSNRSSSGSSTTRGGFGGSSRSSSS